ncbi:MAG: cytochrome P450 [Acetobacteraceae bacterium]|nr:cytochrome P450 [Acetobacteraceae bacterium]
MSASVYIPPHPRPLEKRLPLRETIRRGRESFLALYYADQYERDWFASRILLRPMFFCNSPDTVREAFIDKAALIERKSPQMRHALEPLLGDGLFISDGLVWKARRRTVQAATHVSRIAELIPVMTEVVEEWVRSWEARAGQEIDILADMAELTSEIICRALFGRQLGSRARRVVVEAFTAYQAKVEQMDVASLVGLPDWFPRFQGLRVGREARHIQRVVGELVDAILAAPEGEGSLIRAMAEAGTMSRDGFRNEAATLFMAGHETTANTLAWAWWLLANAPWEAEALRAEADAALGGRVASHEDLPNLPRARAVIEETLRLYPPVPVLAREASDATTIAGQPIAKGTMVAISLWLLHRHRKWWQRPDHFEPERFLPGAAPVDRYSYVPFSLGPRVCTGMHFGLYEAIIALSGLAQRFTVSALPGHEAFPVARLTTRPGAELRMRLDRRAA